MPVPASVGGPARAGADDPRPEAGRGPRTSYRRAMRAPGVFRISAGGVLGRLPDSMGPIAVLLIAHARGSYAVGGLLVAVEGLLAAGAGPVWGRVADRRGTRPTLLITGLSQAASLVALGPAIGHGAGPAVLVAALAGIMHPPVAGAVRTQWAALEPGSRQVMQALESALTELVFVVGPVLVGGILVVGTAQDALYAAAGLVTLGTLLLAGAALQPVTRSPVRDRLGPLRLPALRLLSLVFGIQVMSFGVLEVGVTALCTNRGESPVTGPLLGLWAVGSAAGGLLWGARRPRAAARTELLVLCCLQSVLLALFNVSGNPAVLFAVAVPAGLAIAPVGQTVNALIARTVPVAQLTEAYGWSAGFGPALGGSLGYVAAASIAQHSSPRLAIALAAAVSAVAPVLVLARRRVLPPD